MGFIIQKLLRNLYISPSTNYNNVLDFQTALEIFEREVRKGGEGAGYRRERIQIFALATLR